MKTAYPFLLNKQIVANDAIVVGLEFNASFLDDEYIEVTGTSKRASDDEFDPEVGMALAYARAFETLSKKLYRRGLGKMQHNDQMRAKKATNKKDAQKALKEVLAMPLPSETILKKKKLSKVEKKKMGLV